MKNVVNIKGLNFSIVEEVSQETYFAGGNEKTPHVKYQNGMFDRTKTKPLEDFKNMVSDFVLINTRNGQCLEPKNNNRADNEVYPA